MSSSKQESLFDQWNKQMSLIQEKTGIKGIYVIVALVTSIILVYLNLFLYELNLVLVH